MKPTEGQIKEFWGRYEVRPKKVMCNHPYREELHYPPIDLNNLFKYAPAKMTAILWRKIIREWASSLTGDYEKDTLALFWALDEVRDK